MPPLVGTVRPNGRIQFLKEHNPGVFASINKSKTPVHRIKVLPSQTEFEIQDPEPNSESDFAWLPGLKRKLLTADSIFLSHKDGALRFGSAVHNLDKSRKFFTIGTVQEAQKFARERWANLRYFYANKLDDFRFATTTMMTYKEGHGDGVERIELPVRLDSIEGFNDPQTIFDATGSNATMEIVDWRNSVNVGELGRFSPENKKVTIVITKISQPFTFLEEFRDEFSNYAYTFACEKINQRLEKLIDKTIDSNEASV